MEADVMASCINKTSAAMMHIEGGKHITQVRRWDDQILDMYIWPIEKQMGAIMVSPDSIFHFWLFYMKIYILHGNWCGIPFSCSCDKCGH